MGITHQRRLWLDDQIDSAITESGSIHRIGQCRHEVPGVAAWSGHPIVIALQTPLQMKERTPLGLRLVQLIQPSAKIGTASFELATLDTFPR